MKYLRIFLALIVFLLPVGARLLWFYQGTYQRQSPVATPDYAAIALSKAPASDVLSATPVPQAASDSPLVVIDAYHSNTFMVTEIEPLTQILDQMGARVEYNDGSVALGDQLKVADAYIIITPSSTFSTDETKAIARFVKQGGSLLVISDPTHTSAYDSYLGITYSTIQYVNQVLLPFHMAFRSDYAYNLVENDSNFRNLIIKDLPASDLSDQVKQVVLYGAQTLQTDQTPVLSGDANTLSSIDDRGGDLPLAAMSKEGRVLAIGDLSFLSPNYIKVASNEQFTRNIARFLTGGSYTTGLTNFPILFKQPVTLLFDAETALDSSMVQAIASLQSSLQNSFNIEVQIASKDPGSRDLIVTGTFDKLDAEMLAPFIEKYDLTFEEDTGEGELNYDIGTEPVLEPTPEPGAAIEPTPAPTDDFSSWFGTGDMTGGEETTPVGTVTFPEIGKFDSASIGLLIYQPGDDHNVLVLLADSDASLVTLAGILNSGSLSSCLVKGEIAVCSLGANFGTGY